MLSGKKDRRLPEQIFYELKDREDIVKSADSRTRLESGKSSLE